MNNHVDAALAAPPTITSGLYIAGVPVSDVVLVANLAYVLVLFWLKWPEIKKRLQRKD